MSRTPTTGEVLVERDDAADPRRPIAKSAHDIAEEFGDVIAERDSRRRRRRADGATRAEERFLRRTWYPTLSVIGMGGIPLARYRRQRPARPTRRPCCPSDFRRASIAKRMGEAVREDHRPPTCPRTRTVDLQDQFRRQMGGPRPSSRRGSPRPSSTPPSTASAVPAGFTGEGGSIPFLASLATALPRRPVRRDRRRRSALERPRHRRDAGPSHGGWRHERGHYCVESTRHQVRKP